MHVQGHPRINLFPELSYVLDAGTYNAGYGHRSFTAFCCHVAIDTLDPFRDRIQVLKFKKNGHNLLEPIAIVLCDYLGADKQVDNSQ